MTEMFSFKDLQRGTATTPVESQIEAARTIAKGIKKWRESELKNLTDIQQKAYDFVKVHLYEKGYPPTLRELRDYMGYGCIASAQDLVAALRRKGYLLTPDKQIARALVPVCFLATNDDQSVALGVESADRWRGGA